MTTFDYDYLLVREIMICSTAARVPRKWKMLSNIPCDRATPKLFPFLFSFHTPKFLILFIIFFSLFISIFFHRIGSTAKSLFVIQINVSPLIIHIPILHHNLLYMLFPSFTTTRKPPFFFIIKKKMSYSATISEIEQEELLEKLEVFKIKGKDKRGRKILRIIGKFFPARLVSVDVLNKFLEERVFPKLGKRKFSVLYVHTGVNRSENFPGISALRSIYDAIPANVKDNLEAVYFIHSGLQARLFLATFGRFLFSAGLYGKLRYVSRVDYLWEYVRRNEVEIPEFVFDHDEDLEYRPMMDYGLESDHARVYGGAPTVDSPVSTYSMRCIS